MNMKIYKYKGELFAIPNDNIITLYNISSLYNSKLSKLSNHYYNPDNNEFFVIEKDDTELWKLSKVDSMVLLSPSSQKINIDKAYIQFPKIEYVEYIDKDFSYVLIDKKELEEVNVPAHIIETLYKKIQIAKIQDDNLYDSNHSIWWEWEWEFNDYIISGRCINPKEHYVSNNIKMTNILYNLDISHPEKTYWMITISYLKKDGKRTQQTIPHISNEKYYKINDIIKKVGSKQISILFHSKIESKEDFYYIFSQ